MRVNFTNERLHTVNLADVFGSGVYTFLICCAEVKCGRHEGE